MVGMTHKRRRTSSRSVSLRRRVMMIMKYNRMYRICEVLFNCKAKYLLTHSIVCGCCCPTGRRGHSWPTSYTNTGPATYYICEEFSEIYLVHRVGECIIDKQGPEGAIRLRIALQEDPDLAEGLPLSTQ